MHVILNVSYIPDFTSKEIEDHIKLDRFLSQTLLSGYLV